MVLRLLQRESCTCKVIQASRHILLNCSELEMIISNLLFSLRSVSLLSCRCVKPRLRATMSQISDVLALIKIQLKVVRVERVAKIVWKIQEV